MSLAATQQLCAAGALVALLHREGAIAAPLDDVGPGSRHLLAVNSIAEVLHAQQTLLPGGAAPLSQFEGTGACRVRSMVCCRCLAGVTGRLPDGGRCIAGSTAGTSTAAHACATPQTIHCC